MESSSLRKAFGLLEVLADFGGEAPLAQLAMSIHLPRPTVHRLLHALSSLGYVEHEPGGVYRIAPKLKWLAIEASQRPLANLADPVLRRLHACTGETVNLGVLRHDRICYLTVLESIHPLRRIARIQDSDPVFTTALGRAIVAHLSDARREQLIAALTPDRRTRNTVTEPAALRRLLKAALAQGYAIERDETDVGVTCIAAPVRAGAGDPVAALSLSAPSARVTAAVQREWTAAVCAAAKSLSQIVSKQHATGAGAGAARSIA